MHDLQCCSVERLVGARSNEVHLCGPQFLSSSFRHSVAVWWRNVVGIGCVGRLRSTLGASMACGAELLTAGGRDALHPSESPHHPGRSPGDRPLDRAHGRAGPALQREHRDHPQVAQARSCKTARTTRSRPHKLPWKATEEERAIVCALRHATGFPLDDLTFVVTPLPAASQPRCGLPHPQGRGAGPPAASAAAQAAERHVQGLRSRLRAHGHQAPAQAERPPTARAASASSMWPSTAARAGCTWPSRRTS